MTTRRQLLQALAATAILPACRRKAPSPSAPEVTSALAQEPCIIHAWFDLPSDARSRELSGIAWEAATGTLWAVQDERPSVVPLIPDDDLRSWTLGTPVMLNTQLPLDLEGIVVTPKSFIVASEIGPKVIEFDRKGEVIGPIPLPSHFTTARSNRSLESLTVSPDGTQLFTTSEWTLGCDGETPTTTHGSHVRILRISRDGKKVDEHAYASEPTPHHGGDYGIADLAALDGDQLLVLERGWTAKVGNTARIYRTSLAQPEASCLDASHLDDGPTLKKELVVDLGALPARGLPTPKQAQPTPLLDNYEGMALGPKLKDGRQSIILVTDDNNRPDQIARLLVLGVTL